MIIRCPHCGNEYDLELDDTVVELTFTCPNCRKSFRVRNNVGVVDMPQQREMTDESKYQPHSSPPPLILDHAQQESNSQTEAEKDNRKFADDRKPQKTRGENNKHLYNGGDILRIIGIFTLATIIVGILIYVKKAGIGKEDTEEIETAELTPKCDNATMLVIDVSKSMLAEDLKPNRIEAVKRTVLAYIRSHPKDSIGVIAFAGESFTAMPIQEIVDSLSGLYNLENVKAQLVQKGEIVDGTAIGLGVANATYYLMNSQARHKKIILFTDGMNTGGEIPPLMAADIARVAGVCIYTIGIGSEDKVPYKTLDQVAYIKMDMDIELLKAIAQNTGGCFFVANNNRQLESACKQIDKLESEKVDKTTPSHPSKDGQISMETAQCILNAVARKDKQLQKRIKKCKVR